MPAPLQKADHYRRNRARHQAQGVEWRKANAERVRELDRQQYARQGELIRARSAAYRAANPERARAAVVAWGEANPERKRELDSAYQTTHASELKVRRATRYRATHPKPETPVKRRRRAVVTYRGAHRRTIADRGPASSYSCVDCGHAARQWSYDHSDLAQLLSAKGAAYSTDPAHYQPRCVPCHLKFDRST